MLILLNLATASGFSAMLIKSVPASFKAAAPRMTRLKSRFLGGSSSTTVINHPVIKRWGNPALANTDTGAAMYFAVFSIIPSRPDGPTPQFAPTISAPAFSRRRNASAPASIRYSICSLKTPVFSATEIPHDSLPMGPREPATQSFPPATDLAISTPLLFI